MPRFHFALLLLLIGVSLVGCSGPKPGPPPPAPAEAGVAPHYEKAYATLRVHPAVQAFAAEHLDASQTIAIEVSPEVVPLDYTVVAADMLGDLNSASLARQAVVEDSLAALSARDHFAPSTDEGLALLSMRQQRPLVLFFGELQDGRLPAQLYPNPYRRQGFEAITDGVPGLALLLVFDGSNVADVFTGRIDPQ